MLFQSITLAQNFNQISKRIQHCHKHLDKYYDRGQLYHKLRGKTEILKNIYNYQKCDTIFLLELDSEPADCALYILAWNRSDTAFYYVENLNNPIITKDMNYTFPDYMCNLVSRWDCNELEKQVKLYNNFMITRYVYATRIIINKKKYHIDCMRFVFFFNPQRDQFPIMY